MEELLTQENFTLLCCLIFGLIFGSFLSACIYRVPREISLSNPPRSFCTSCDRKLNWWENIPVLSWTFLRGRCLCKKNKISVRYPLVEIMSGMSALASYIYYGLNPTGIVIYILLAALITITFIDFDFKIIPDVISLPGIVIGLAIGIVSQYFPIFSKPPITSGVIDSLIGFVVGGGSLYAIGYIYYFATGQIGLGGGDIKLLALVGSLMGWQVIPVAIFVGSMTGSIVGVVTMIAQRSGRQTEIPFGPWLSLGIVFYIFNIYGAQSIFGLLNGF